MAAYQLPPPLLLWLAALPDGSPMTNYLPPIKREDRTPLRHRAAVASTLIAGLMLALDGKLTLEQNDIWQAIRVRESPSMHVNIHEPALLV